MYLGTAGARWVPANWRFWEAASFVLNAVCSTLLLDHPFGKCIRSACHDRTWERSCFRSAYPVSRGRANIKIRSSMHFQGPSRSLNYSRSPLPKSRSGSWFRLHTGTWRVLLRAIKTGAGLHCAETRYPYVAATASWLRWVDFLLL